MTESLCSTCKLLGKPPARINFIVAAGLSDSLVYQRIKYLLKHYSEDSSAENDARLTNYGTLKEISQQLFNLDKNVLSADQSTSVDTEKCCHGFTVYSLAVDDISDSSQIDAFQKYIFDLLDSNVESTTGEQNGKSDLASWIMFHGSMYLEPQLLDVFLRLKNQSSSLPSYTFTVLCFLMDENQLFENWFFRDEPIQDYQSRTYPEYERGINNFFSLLNSSQDLQQNTLLINEQDVSTADQLQMLLHGIFRNKSAKYSAKNDKLRSDMKRLLRPRQRTVRDVRGIRNSLQNYYIKTVENRLYPLYHDLKDLATGAHAARQISYIVLDEFDRMNDEERRVYKRQLLLGFKNSDAKNSSTITAQLVHYALHLLQNDEDTSTPLIYAIVLAICRLATHFIFRHELFNNTPDIYTLSLLLITQRQYALVLCGFRLCGTILDGDQIEHKYALAFIKHDPLAVRKILDAIKWLFSPFLTLKNVWKEEEELEKDDLE